MTVERPTAPLEATAGLPGVGLVSVIVPHLDDYDNLDTCLSLLQAQSFPGNRTEVIVVDNGSLRGLTHRRVERPGH
jgi:hypothetical protein